MMPVPVATAVWTFRVQIIETSSHGHGTSTPACQIELGQPVRGASSAVQEQG